MRQGRDGTEERPRLLFATRDLPLPPRSGAPLRTHRLLTGLAKEFDVTLVTYEHDPSSGHEPVSAADLRDEFPGVAVRTVAGLGGGKRLAQLAGLPRGASYEWGRYRRPQLVAALRAVAQDAAPHVAHLDDPGVALAGPVPGAVNAFAPHNVEHRIQARTADSGAGLRGRFAAREAVRIEREERRLWQQADACVAVSEVDAATMRDGGAREVLVAPNGTDPVAAPPPLPRRAPDEPLRVLFVGQCEYWPNAHGVAWFVTEVLPLLRGRVPVAFDVVGTAPARPVEAEGVTYHGRVPELAPFYEAAHVVIAPLFIGSGTRLKVVEALNWRRPLVSTTVGAEGIPATPGRDYRRADDPEAFAAELADLARAIAEGDPALDATLAEARAAVEELQWPRIAARLAQDYRALAARGAGTRSPSLPTSAR